MLAELTAKAAKLLTKPYFQVVVTLTHLCHLAEISTLWIFVCFFEQNFFLSFHESYMRHAGLHIKIVTEACLRICQPLPTGKQRLFTWFRWS